MDGFYRLRFAKQSPSRNGYTDNENRVRCHLRQILEPPLTVQEKRVLHEKKYTLSKPHICGFFILTIGVLGSVKG